jgi:transcriptional regulator with XRE-family HTH domain
MVIGEKVKALREQKKMYQGDIEKRTGLLRFYLSRVENGHTVPAIETLEEIARAMEVPMYVLFYDGEKPPAPELPKIAGGNWGSSGRDARTLGRFRRLLRRTSKADQNLLMFMAQKMSQRKHPRGKSRAQVIAETKITGKIWGRQACRQASRLPYSITLPSVTTATYRPSWINCITFLPERAN